MSIEISIKWGKIWIALHELFFKDLALA